MKIFETNKYLQTKFIRKHCRLYRATYNTLHALKMPVQIQNFINGEFTEFTGKFTNSENPANKELTYAVPHSQKEEAEQAIAAADAAFTTWSKTKFPVRSRYLKAIAEALQEKADFLAEVESRDQGKTKAFAASVDIPGGIGALRTQF